MSSEDQITIALFDHSEARINQIQHIVNEVSDFELVAVYNDYDNIPPASEECIQLKPDIILLEANMRVDLVAPALVKKIPASAMILLTSGDQQSIMFAMENGVRFHLGKYFYNTRFVEFIRSAYQQYELVRKQFKAAQKHKKAD